jgi:NAD+ kinase
VNRPLVVVVAKRSMYERFIQERSDPKAVARFQSHDISVARWRQAHLGHQRTLKQVQQILRSLGARLMVLRSPGVVFDASDATLVVSVGGDGTLLAASHQIGDGIPLLGINSAPDHSIGFFCGGKKGNVLSTLRRAIQGRLPVSELTRMRVDLNGKTLHARVLNEALFCHASPAATSRYILRITRGNGTFMEEDQRSSGMWIGPAAGSTAAQRSAGGNVLPLGSRRIQYVVREPYHPAGRRPRFSVGLLDADGKLTLRSKIRDGRVFLDGHRIVHAVTIGDVLVMRRSPDRLSVLGLATKRRA